jgi:hypothetical protein
MSFPSTADAWPSTGGIRAHQIGRDGDPRRLARRALFAGALLVAMGLAAAAGYYTGPDPVAPLGDPQGGASSNPSESVMLAWQGNPHLPA